MRATAVSTLGALAALGLALGAGCDPDIAPGAYLCGPEQLCPEGQVCNGPDNVCVLPGSREPFLCPVDEVVPSFSDDTPATGQTISQLACVSLVAERSGCLDLGDVVDWYQFDTPPECAAVEVVARIQFPKAFQPLSFRFSDNGSAATAVESPCDVDPSDEDGGDVRCFTMTVQPGRRYAVGVERDGVDCGGGCPYNRYLLTLRLRTP